VTSRQSLSQHERDIPVIVVKRFRKVRVKRLGQFHFFVKYVDYADARLLDQLDHILCTRIRHCNSSKAHLIVDVIYSLRFESFYFIKLHLVFQCSLVEKLLQLFIAVIDAKLLKGVVFKVLEAGNIKNADEA
jgi:hypothetical protein